MIHHPFRYLATCLVALVLVFVPVASASAAPSDTYEADAIRYTNAERTKRGLVALRGQSCVDLYAERLAAALSREQRLRHSNLETIRKACRLRTVGENVAYGYPNGRAVTQGWMSSTVTATTSCTHRSASSASAPCRTAPAAGGWPRSSAPDSQPLGFVGTRDRRCSGSGHRALVRNRADGCESRAAVRRS